MNELLAQLQMKMEAFQKDAALQAEKGNKAAGQRARCVSLEMEPLLKQFRNYRWRQRRNKTVRFYFSCFQILIVLSRSWCVSIGTFL